MDPTQLLHELFREEAHDQVARLLLELTREDGADEARLREARRVVHNLKGAALSIGATTIATACHDLEDELEAQSGGAATEPPPWDRWLAVVRWLDEECEGYSTLSRAAPASEAPLLPSLVPTAGSKYSSEGTPPMRRSELPQGVQWLPPATDAALRVQGQQLDEPLRAVGQLLLSQVAVQRWAAAAREQEAQLATLLASNAHLPVEVAAILRGLEGTLIAVQQAALRDEETATRLRAQLTQLRVVPLTRLLPSLRRTVQQVAASLAKEVELVAELGESELDAHLLASLQVPLEHLVRNAVDHGIEAPDAREAAGKPRAGRITLQASIAGQRLQLRIGDDGRGVDLAALTAQALKRGLLTEGEAAALSDDERAELLFLPSLSTASSVSQVSGRGMGMDAARSALERVGGTLRLQQGTSGGAAFLLEFPSHFITTACLLVRSKGTPFAIASHLASRVVRLEAVNHDFGYARGRESQGTWFPIHRPEELLAGEATFLKEPSFAVLLEVRGRSLGLVIDELVSEGPLMVQPLPGPLTGLAGVHGVALLPEGEVALALDAAALLLLAAKLDTHQVSAGTAAARAPHVLVADDSAVIRSLSRDALRAAGFAVTTAEDGEEAWELIQREAFQVIVSDVQMPKLDGLSLTRRIRAHRHTEGLPVVLVTTRSAEADVHAGAQAGANAYIVKGELAQRDLIATVRRFVDS